MPGKIKECTILFISHKANLYGAERCCLDLILNLPERIKPIVIMPGTGPFLDIIKKNKIEYYVIHFMGWWHKKFRLLYMQRAFLNLFISHKILMMIKGRKIQMVYTNTLYSPIGAFLATALNVPHLWHTHEFVHLNHGDHFDFGQKISMAFVNRFSDLVLCTSKAHQADLSRFIEPAKIRVVHNGVDRKSIGYGRGSHDHRDYKILMIGSITENKGHTDAIRALHALIQNGLKITLTIVGDGNQKYIRQLKLLQERSGLAGHIRWEGFKINTDNYISDSDILLMCSRFETFGRVVIEAMSFGCPVIASNAGGISDILDDGVNGFTYDHGDFETLTRKIMMLLKNKELYAQISNNALRSFNEKFTKDRYVREMVHLLDDVIASDKRLEKRIQNKSSKQMVS
jgi:glycosyltransferase involved in cell wall biosynthesis